MIARLNSLFPATHSTKPAQVGVIVYRKIAGQLEMLLVEGANQTWSIPMTAVQGDETAEQAALRIVAKAIGDIEVQLLQALGQVKLSILRRYRTTNHLLQLFLVRAFAPTETSLNKKASWHQFDDAFAKVSYQELAQMMLLVATKIKRAQIQ